MPSRLILAAPPPLPPLTPPILAQILPVLAGGGLSPSDPRWLGEGEAVEIPLAASLPPEARAAEEARLRHLLGERPIDLALLPAESARLPKLLLSDMDATAIEEETLDELAAEAGLKEEVARITEQAMRGEIDFPTALRGRVALLEGLKQEALDRVIARLRPSPGAAVLTATLKALGVRLVLVSGGFTQVTAAVRQRLGFDADQANQLEIADGRLTGRVVEPIRDSAWKARVLAEEAAALGIGMEVAVAIGDGANDIPMLQAAGLGIAWRAKPRTEAAADARIRHGDLRVALYYLGVSREQFVTPGE